MVTTSSSARHPNEDDEPAARARILEAAFAAFMENGYSATSTLEIATRARVSKRELYALVGNKRAMLIACISQRAKRLEIPVDLPLARDRETLAQVLIAVGTQLLQEISDPTVVAVFRLAIAESARTPEVALALDSIGRATSRATLRNIMLEAQASKLLDGRPADLGTQFWALLCGDLMVSLLLGVAKRPDRKEITKRARNAAADFLKLHALNE